MRINAAEWPAAGGFRPAFRATRATADDGPMADAVDALAPPTEAPKPDAQDWQSFLAVRAGQKPAATTGPQAPPPPGQARDAQNQAEAPERQQVQGPGGAPQKAEPGQATAMRGQAELTPEQKAEVAELRQRDAEVRAHEAAHAAAAGAMGGGATFEYATGPDGRSYAVAGEVHVQLAAGGSPEETIRNAAQLRAAALAPAEPSGQDRAVAAEAAAMEAAARAQLAELSNLRAQVSRADAAAAAAPSDQAGNDDGQATQVAANQIKADERPSELTLAQLESEQRTVRGGWRHLHSNDGCGPCGRAVAAYR